MHYWEIRKYDNGTFIGSESDADGSTQIIRENIVVAASVRRGDVFDIA